MAKGENIFKRKDGRWEARYHKGRDADGKIQYGFCYGKTYREAKEKAEKYKAEIITGWPTCASGAGGHLSVFCDEWLRANQSKYRESTLIKYIGIIDRHIKPRLGGINVTKLNNIIIGDFTEKLEGEDGLSPKTVKDILTVLKLILNYVAKQLPYGLHGIEIIYPYIPKKRNACSVSRGAGRACTISDRKYG